MKQETKKKKRTRADVEKQFKTQINDKDAVFEDIEDMSGVEPKIPTMDDLKKAIENAEIKEELEDEVVKSIGEKLDELKKKTEPITNLINEINDKKAMITSEISKEGVNAEDIIKAELKKALELKQQLQKTEEYRHYGNNNISWNGSRII